MNDILIIYFTENENNYMYRFAEKKIFPLIFGRYLVGY